jgi:nitroreductase
MNFDEIVHGRRSIRGYKPDSIPKDVMTEIIKIATRAPSSMNTQPWHLHVISGEPLNRIRAGNTERNIAGVPPSREFRVEGKYEGVHRDRQVKVAIQLFEAMGIAREDADRRKDWVLRGFRQFDAPVSVIVAYDKVLQGDIRHFDLGAVIYGLVLAAWSRGIGSVINSQGIMQSPVVREHAGIPEDHVIQTSVAMGYPDYDFPSNAVVSTRRPVEEVATFIGFDGAP